MPRPEAVVFDLDGTLIHSAPELLNAANTYLAGLDRAPLTLAELQGFIGNGVPTLVKRLRAARALDTGPEDIARFLGIYQNNPVGHTTVYPGVVAALQTLSLAGVPLGVCTNKPEKPTRDILDHFGINRYFRTVVGGDTLPVHKPDPAPLRHAMQELASTSVLFVGDSEVDCATAQAAGQPFALFTEGYRKSPVQALRSSLVFDRYDGFAQTVLRIVSPQGQRA